MAEDTNENAGPCLEFAERLVLMASGELDRGEAAEVEDHLAHCSACAEALDEERRFLDLFARAERHEPSAGLLAECRSQLVDVLDQREEKGLLGRWLDAVAPSHWIALHPSLSAALLVAIGFAVGTVGPKLMLRTPVSGGPETAQTPESGLNAQPGASDADLRTADVTGINWTSTADNAPPKVELQLKALRPMVVQGPVNSDEVKRVLLNVLRNNQNFDPDVRLDSVELLKSLDKDSDVRQALCHVVHTDRNAAVRLKALEALSGSASAPMVRKTLLDALVDDSNPGVRVEAINKLRTLEQNGEISSDAQLLGILRQRAERDPSTYIRLQSAAMIQDLSPREKY